MNNTTYHTTVLLQEAVDCLHVEKGKKYIDGTLGGGGHSFEIIKRGGVVLGLDVDDEAIAHNREHINKTAINVPNENFLIKKGNYRNIDTLASEAGFENVDGILLDLGISSHHIDVGSRGFSFQHNGPIDMRMDQSLTVSAKDLVNGMSKQELTDLFIRFGEERFAKVVARNIVEARGEKLIETTHELSTVVSRNIPWGKEKISPATRAFQALRIAVNDELHSLEEVLPKAINLLDEGGRLVVISFHSLEDRIIKHQFLEFQEKGLGKIITKKPIVPTDKEIMENSRARSAKMRVFEK